MPNRLGWQFERVGSKGGSASGAWNNPLSGTDLAMEQVLSREALQNSCDAQADNHKVRVHFSRIRLDPERIAALANLLQLRDGPLARLDGLGLPADNLFTKAVGADAAGEALLIEDWNTVGLGGALSGYGDQDRFARLVFFLGLDDWPNGSGRGGTFGYGKTAYANASDVRTVVYYSAFRPTESSEGQEARAFVASFFRTHNFEGRAYTGRAWFGQLDGEEAWPLVDEDAHVFAEHIGLARRDADKIGTSLLVLGSNIDMEHLRASIESYWWPRLLDDDLEVRLFDVGAEVRQPQPAIREDLKDFLHAYEIVTGRDATTTDREAMGTLPPLNAMELGRWAAVGLAPESESDQAEDSEAEAIEPQAVPVNTVALMRKPRMVVQYLPITAQEVPVAGVFVASEEAEEAFRFSEPPAHDAWLHENQRLAMVENGKEAVRLALYRLKVRIREFAKSLAPKPEPLGGWRLTSLEQLLAQSMATPGKGRREAPPRIADPFEVHVQQRAIYDSDSITVAVRAEIRLKEEAEVDSLEARYLLGGAILADDNRIVDEKVAISSLTIDGADVPLHDGATGIVTLGKDESTIVEATTVPLNSEWEVEVFTDIWADNPAAEGGK